MSRTDGVLRAACAVPWAILPEKLEAIFDVLEFHAAGVRFTKDEILSSIGPNAGPRSGTTQGAVAVLPLYGVISQRMNMMSDVSGGTSTEKFAAELDALVQNPQVSAIVLDVDSPGGSTAGVPELAAKIRAARDVKPIYAVANGTMASAAYWLAAQASEIIASPSSFVGSIGVFMVHTDDTEADAQAGLKRTVISAGKYKTEGFGALTDEAKAAAQDVVDQVYGMFTADVAKGRTESVATVRNGYGEGRALLAQDAMHAGMVDRIATLDDLLSELTSQKPPGRLRASHADSLIAAVRQGGSFVPVASLTSLTGTLASASTLVLHPSTAAPKAKEQTVANDNPTVAQDKGATPAEIATMQAAIAKAERAERIDELCSLVNASAQEAMTFKSSDKTVAQVRQELQARVGNPTPISGATNITVGHDRAEAKPFAHFGEFCAAVHQANPQVGGETDARLRPLAAASGMSQGLPSEGGFTVLPQFSNTIWEGVMGQSDSLLARTDNYTIEGESLTFLGNAETSRATGSRWGGVQGYWMSEAAQFTGSKPTFRQIRIEPQQLGVFVYVTEKLLRNSSVALGQYVGRAAPDEINFLVGDAIVNGSGVGQPKGMVASGAKIQVSKETSQAAATINQYNISKMWARLHPRARANAIWLHNVDVEPQLDTLSTVVTNVAGTENVGGYANKVFDPERRTLKGRPIVACEYCATLGTVGDLILTDMSSYLTGTRGGVQSDVSMHIRFDYAEQAFRFLFEVDGQTWLNSAITPKNGSSTLSTVVVLQTR